MIFCHFLWCNSLLGNTSRYTKCDSFSGLYKWLVLVNSFSHARSKLDRGNLILEISNDIGDCTSFSKPVTPSGSDHFSTSFTHHLSLLDAFEICRCFENICSDHYKLCHLITFFHGFELMVLTEYETKIIS